MTAVPMALPGIAILGASSHVLYVPLPPRALTSNQNIHWRAASEPKREYRALAKECAGILELGEVDHLRMSLVFCIGGARSIVCSHKRRPRRDGKPLRSCLRCPYAPRDESNALAAFKAAQDGICEGLGIDDSRKHLTIGGISIDASEGPYVRVMLEVLSGSEGEAGPVSHGGA